MMIEEGGGERAGVWVFGPDVAYHHVRPHGGQETYNKEPTTKPGTLPNLLVCPAQPRAPHHTPPDGGEDIENELSDHCVV